MHVLKLAKRSFAVRGDNMRLMLVAEASQVAIDRQAVGDERGSRFNVVAHKGLDCGLVDGLDAPETDSSESLLRISFNSNKNPRLAFSTPSTLSLLLTSHVRLVNLDAPRQPLPSASHHHAPKLLQPPPGGLIAAESVGVAQVLGTQPCLLRHHQPHDMEPQTQRLATVFENRSRCHGRLMTTAAAVPQTTPRAPSLPPRTLWTHKSRRPTDPFQILQAVVLRGKPVQKLLKRAWKRPFIRCIHASHTTACGCLSQSATQFSSNSQHGGDGCRPHAENWR